LSAKPEILPVIRPREAAGPSYDRMSNWYDLLTGPSEKRYRLAGLTMLDVRPGEQILEIGCGTGHSAVAIAKSVGPHGKITAFDLSAKMLAKTRKRLEKNKLIDQSAVVQGDAYHMPFIDNSFDAIFMSFTLELFATNDISVVLSQCNRILHSGGRLVVVAMCKEENPGAMLRLYEWMHCKFPNMVDCRPIYAAESISDTGFEIDKIRKMSMAGIPVEVVNAIKVKQP
jgi:ubiquinone/menaquinone biosynthesis C-methylase UbiE